MTELATLDQYGIVTEPATLTIRRLLPGPIDRVWAYLTDGDLRRRWLASGRMEMRLGAPFELVWRNDELTSPSGQRPAGFDEEHRMESQITELDPPNKLAFTWGESGTGEVSIELATQGKDVLLTLVHRRLPDDRSTRLNIGAGWHAHLDLLVARAGDKEAEPHWDHWTELRSEYEKLMPA